MKLWKIETRIARYWAMYKSARATQVLLREIEKQSKR